MPLVPGALQEQQPEPQEAQEEPLHLLPVAGALRYLVLAGLAAAALGVSTLRVAPSTYFIGKTHDHFFPTMRPLAPWGRPMDLAKALAHAAEMLPATLSR